MPSARLRRRLPAPGRPRPGPPCARRPRRPAARRGGTPRAGGRGRQHRHRDRRRATRSASSTRRRCWRRPRSAGPGWPVSTVARTVEDGLRLPADIAGEELVRAITRHPGRRSTSSSRTTASIYGVLATADVDRAFRAPRPLTLRSPDWRARGPCRDPARRTRPRPGPASTAGRCAPGEWVRLTDSKGRRHNICLEAGKRFFSNRGHLEHDELIGREEGFTVTSSAGRRVPRVPAAALASSWSRCRAARPSSTPRTPPRSSRWPTSSRARTSSRPASAPAR